MERRVLASSRSSFGGVRRLPSKRYQAYYTGPDGIRHTAPITFQTKGDANAWLIAERRHVEDLANWSPPKQRLKQMQDERRRQQLNTFGAFADGWLTHRKDPCACHKKPLSDRTWHEYAKLLRSRILPVFAQTPLTDITTSMVRDWLRSSGTRTPTSAKHAYDLLRKIMNDAVSDELLPLNPVKVPGAGTANRDREPVVLTYSELESLVAATPERYRLMVMLAAWCGLRRGEVAALERGDINVPNQMVTVSRTVVFVSGKDPIVKEPKTTAGRRTVAIPGHIMPAIQDALDRFGEPGPTGILFPAPRGGYQRDSATGRWFHAARKAAGVPNVRFHDLRHTGATYAGAAGATIAELQHRIGHATPAAVMMYQHATVERDQEIARKIADKARLLATTV